MSERSLRIAAITDSNKIPAWKYKLLETIVDTGHLDLCAIFILAGPVKSNGAISTFLQTKWQKFDAKRVKHKATKPVSISSLNISSEKYLGTARLEQNALLVDSDTIARVKSLNLDVIINLTDWVPKGELLDLAENGVWQYFYGDYNQNKIYATPGYHEVLTDDGYSGTFLFRLQNQPNELQLLYESYSFVDNASLSRCVQIHWKSSAFVKRKLDLLHQLGPAQFNALLPPESAKVAFKYLPKTDQQWEPLKMTMLQAYRTFSKKLKQKIVLENWILLYHFSSNPSSILSDSKKIIPQFKKIIPPKDRYWADPFVYFRDDKHYIFMEEVPLKTKKGHIAVIEIDKDGTTKPPITILEKPFHLSYPFLLEWEGELYMIPESSQNQTIDVYKCTRFPDKWEHYKTLFDGVQAADTTLFQHNGKWWLFVNIRAYSGYPNWDELFLFYADHPFSDQWVSHPKNPVISDVRRARPAGKIFKSDGLIYRPSQNCSKRYGYGLKLNQIVTLNETEYKEVEVSSIEPLWDKKIKSVHTFNFDHGISVIDGQYQMSKI